MLASPIHGSVLFSRVLQIDFPKIRGLTSTNTKFCENMSVVSYEFVII